MLARGGAGRDHRVAIDRHRQHEAVVVVDVLADEIHAARRGDDPPRRLAIALFEVARRLGNELFEQRRHAVHSPRTGLQPELVLKMLAAERVLRQRVLAPGVDAADAPLPPIEIHRDEILRRELVVVLGAFELVLRVMPGAEIDERLAGRLQAVALLVGERDPADVGAIAVFLRPAVGVV